MVVLPAPMGCLRLSLDPEKGSKLGYTVAVEHWFDYYDSMSDTNPKKVLQNPTKPLRTFKVSNFCGSCLLEQLISSKHPTHFSYLWGWSFFHIVAQCNFDPLSLVTEVVLDFITLGNTRCGDNESLKRFESCFPVAFVWNNALCSSTVFWGHKESQVLISLLCPKHNEFLYCLHICQMVLQLLTIANLLLLIMTTY